MTNFRRNILESAGSLQLRAGQRAGCEATAHALSSIFSQHGSDAILLVDADNGFNWLKRIVTLHNIRIICLVIATYIINLHSQEVRFFISQGEEIASAEGKIQGDYSLNFYELAITVCISVAQACPKVRVACLWLPTDTQNLSGLFRLYCRVCNNCTVTVI